MLDIGSDLPESGRGAIFSREINRLKDAVRRLQPIPSLNILTSVTGVGTVRQALESKARAQPGVIKKYLVKAENDDTLSCVEFDGSEGAAVTVAKIFELRKTGWDGVDVVYTVPAYPGAVTPRTIHYHYISPSYRIATITGGGVATEHQVVTPLWVPNKTLIFGSTVENGTGIDGVDVQDVGCARAWARAI